MVTTASIQTLSLRDLFNISDRQKDLAKRVSLASLPYFKLFQPYKNLISIAEDGYELISNIYEIKNIRNYIKTFFYQDRLFQYFPIGGMPMPLPGSIFQQ